MFLLIITLSIIIFQDLKSRAISWWTIPLLLGSILYIRITAGEANLLWLEGCFNLFFLAFQYLLITIYFSLKQRQIVNIADNYLGWGDILFLIPIAFLFPTISFFIFYLSSIIIVLIGFLIYKTIVNKNIETIPLAGGQSIYLIAFLIFSKVFDLPLNSNFFPPLF